MNTLGKQKLENDALLVRFSKANATSLFIFENFGSIK